MEERDEQLRSETGYMFVKVEGRKVLQSNKNLTKMYSKNKQNIVTKFQKREGDIRYAHSGDSNN